MENINSEKPLNAFLVGIQLPRVSDQEMKASLAELARLVTTLGYNVIGETSQRRQSERRATVFGDGKLKDIAAWTGGPGVVGPTFVKKKHKAALKFKKKDEEEDDDLNFDDLDADLDYSTEAEDPSEIEDTAPQKELAQVVVVDCELSPSQIRNLESATGAQVLDRTGVIIEIFSRHARTRAARLQVEIAKLTYVAPRLREISGGEDRQGGGIGGKGAGESSVELDRRKIRDRIKELKQEFSSIAQEHDVRRARRGQEITVALVGYTNAGKSSLMRALTGSDVLVADKLFATLDTTVRVLYPESKPKILVSDTVGFIKKLPHDLVASFKSTLDEALNASLLLYVVDSADPTFRSQLEVTRSVLAEVGAGEIESLMILNKVDKLSPEELTALKSEFPNAYFMSSLNADDVAALRLHLIKHFETAMVDQDVFIPYDVQGAIGEIRAKLRVLSESYDERGVTLKVRAHSDDIGRIKTRFGI
ncbi:GTPase HflX [Bdellovibrio bacteriovorus]|uniref:GTPase HflX n=1 Tax=Bdellovibrio TaxID=958 RepID=UPI0035A8EC0D